MKTRGKRPACLACCFTDTFVFFLPSFFPFRSFVHFFRNYTNPYNRGCLRNWAEVFCVRVKERNCDFSAKVDSTMKDII